MKRVKSANLADMKISAYLSALAARAPSPGGGSAAALAAALGVACALKAAAFTKTRNLAPSRRKTFGAMLKALNGALGVFERAVSRDAVCYRRVSAASKRLSSAKIGGGQARAAGRLVLALERAADVPAAAAREARRTAGAVAGSRRDFNPRFASDIACAELLLAASARACRRLAAENLAAARRASAGAKK